MDLPKSRETLLIKWTQKAIELFFMWGAFGGMLMGPIIGYCFHLDKCHDDDGIHVQIRIMAVVAAVEMTLLVLVTQQIVWEARSIIGNGGSEESIDEESIDEEAIVWTLEDGITRCDPEVIEALKRVGYNSPGDLQGNAVQLE
jgi:hypothetical protein